MRLSRFILTLGVCLGCLGCATERAAQFEGTAHNFNADGTPVTGHVRLQEYGQVELIHFRDEDEYMIRVDLTDQRGWDSCVRGDFDVQSRTRFVPIEALHAIPMLFGAPE
jgi:hypothetical protein